jgi:hypothetical protein
MKTEKLKKQIAKLEEDFMRADIHGIEIREIEDKIIQLENRLKTKSQKRKNKEL